MDVIRLNKQRGFSLIELLLVLTILAIISAIAIGTFGTAQESMGRENLAREFKANLDRARSDSIRRRVTSPANMANIVLTGANTYQLNADFNYNGTLDTNEVRTFTLPDNKGALVTTGLNFPVLIMFDWRGQARVVDNSGNTVNPNFKFCNQGCQTSPGTFYTTAENTTTVSLSAAGDVRVESGIFNPPVSSTPTITTINGNQNIRSDARVIPANNSNGN